MRMHQIKCPDCETVFERDAEYTTGFHRCPACQTLLRVRVAKTGPEKGTGVRVRALHRRKLEKGLGVQSRAANWGQAHIGPALRTPSRGIESDSYALTEDDLRRITSTAEELPLKDAVLRRTRKLLEHATNPETVYKVHEFLKKLGYSLDDRDPKYVRTLHGEMVQHKVPKATRMQFLSRVYGGKGGYKSEELHRIATGREPKGGHYYIYPFVKNAPPEVNRILEATYRRYREQGASKQAAAIAAWSKVKQAGYKKTIQPASVWAKEKKMVSYSIQEVEATKALAAWARNHKALLAAAAGGPALLQRLRMLQRRNEEKAARQHFNLVDSAMKLPGKFPHTTTALASGTLGAVLMHRHTKKRREHYADELREQEVLRSPSRTGFAAQANRAAADTAAGIRRKSINEGLALTQKATNARRGRMAMRIGVPGLAVAGVGMGALVLHRHNKKMKEARDKESENYFDKHAYSPAHAKALKDAVKRAQGMAGASEKAVAAKKALGGMGKFGIAMAAGAGLSVGAVLAKKIVDSLQNRVPYLPDIRTNVEMEGKGRSGYLLAADPTEYILQYAGEIPVGVLETLRAGLSRAASSARNTAAKGMLAFLTGFIASELAGRGISRKKQQIEVNGPIVHDVALRQPIKQYKGWAKKIIRETGEELAGEGMHETIPGFERGGSERLRVANSVKRVMQRRGVYHAPRGYKVAKEVEAALKKTVAAKKTSKLGFGPKALLVGSAIATGAGLLHKRHAHSHREEAKQSFWLGAAAKGVVGAARKVGLKRGLGIAEKTADAGMIGGSLRNAIVAPEKESSSAGRTYKLNEKFPGGWDTAAVKAAYPSRWAKAGKILKGAGQVANAGIWGLMIGSMVKDALPKRQKAEAPSQPRPQSEEHAYAMIDAAQSPEGGLNIHVAKETLDTIKDVSESASALARGDKRAFLEHTAESLRERIFAAMQKHREAAALKTQRRTEHDKR
jgi:hypothetical protein